jgi:hypothetical protein
MYYMSGDAWKEGGIDATGKHDFSLRTCLAFSTIEVKRGYAMHSSHYIAWVIF